MTTETYFDSMIETVHEDPRPGAWRVLADYLEDAGEGKRAELAAITAEMLEGNPARQARAQELIKDGVKPVAVKETLEANGVEFTFSLVPAVYHYYVGTTPVTQAQWLAVMDTDPSDFKGDDRPVENVSWYDAQEFCQKIRHLIGKPVRLLTEAEWEYACRAGTTTEYHSGNKEEDLKRAGWFYGNSGNQTHPVGKLEPNVLDLYDMHGNVWEWCQDVYTETPPNVKALTPRPVEGEQRSDPTAAVEPSGEAAGSRLGCSAAVAGTTTAGTAGRPTAAGSGRSTGSGTSDSGSATREDENSSDPTLTRLGFSAAVAGSTTAVSAGRPSTTGTSRSTGSGITDSGSATREDEQRSDPTQRESRVAGAGSTGAGSAGPRAATCSSRTTGTTTSASGSATQEGEQGSDPTQRGSSGAAAGTTSAWTACPRTSVGMILSSGSSSWASGSVTRNDENSTDPTQRESCWV